MSSSSRLGFWAGGPSQLGQSQLRQRPRIEEFERRIREAPSQTEKARLELELERILREYQPTDDEVKRCLF